jgi:hypothetical protein
MPPEGSRWLAHEAFLDRAPERFGGARPGERLPKGSGELALDGVLPTARLAFGKVGVHARAKLSGQRSALAIEQVLSRFGAVHDAQLP